MVLKQGQKETTMFKWLKTNKAIARGTAGLEEKQQATQNKVELSDRLNKMFERRKDEHAVIQPKIERRLGTQHV